MPEPVDTEHPAADAARASGTRLVRINLVAYTRVEYSEVLTVPTQMSDDDLQRLAHRRSREVDGGLYVDAASFWEEGAPTWEVLAEHEAQSEESPSGRVVVDSRGRFAVIAATS